MKAHQPVTATPRPPHHQPTEWDVLAIACRLALTDQYNGTAVNRMLRTIRRPKDTR